MKRYRIIVSLLGRIVALTKGFLHEPAGADGLQSTRSRKVRIGANQIMSWQCTTLLVLLIILTAVCSARESDTGSEPPASVVPGFAFLPTPLAGAIVVNDANLPAALWGDDSYKLAMDRFPPVIVDDALFLTLSYSGGCARHDFTLVADSQFRESDPVRLILFLAHDDNGDRCEAYPTESYRFDLAPVRALYDQTYGSSEGVVCLVLQGPEELLELTYAFQASP